MENEQTAAFLSGVPPGVPPVSRPPGCPRSLALPGRRRDLLRKVRGVLTDSAAPHGGTSPPMYPPALRGSLEGKACFSPASLQPMHLQSRRGAAALPPQAAPPEAPNTATERRARLRLRWVSGNRNPTPTAHPPQCYGRGRLVGFRGDRLCLVPLSCASEGGGPWVLGAASDACVPVRGYLRGG